MKRYTWLGALALLLGACAEPAPPPPSPPPAPQPEQVDEPPPPPKCEAIKEQCKADADTRARIPGTDHVFTPPKGWVYAQLEEATIAQLGDSGPVLLFTTYEPDPDARKAAQQRVDLVNSLSEIVLLEPPARLVLFKQRTPGRQDYAEQELSGLKMSLWERPGGKRGNDQGPLLVLGAALEGRELLGVAFAPKDDQDGTNAIKSALGSIEPAGGSTGGSAGGTGEGEPQ